MHFIKKPGFYIGVIGALITLFFYNAANAHPELDKEIHYHAGFIVYENDQRIDFSDSKYMHTSLCTIEGQEEEEQTETAHLHDGVRDVVHVHDKGLTWGDFFNSISFQFKEPVVGYVNGELKKDILNHPITEYESIVILSGKNTDIETKIHHAVSQEHIHEVENTDKSC
jgi:hypothetical protein